MQKSSTIYQQTEFNNTLNDHAPRWGLRLSPSTDAETVALTIELAQEHSAGLINTLIPEPVWLTSVCIPFQLKYFECSWFTKKASSPE